MAVDNFGREIGDVDISGMAQSLLQPVIQTINYSAKMTQDKLDKTILFLKENTSKLISEIRSSMGQAKKYFEAVKGFANQTKGKSRTTKESSSKGILQGIQNLFKDKNFFKQQKGNFGKDFDKTLKDRQKKFYNAQSPSMLNKVNKASIAANKALVSKNTIWTVVKTFGSGAFKAFRFMGNIVGKSVIKGMKIAKVGAGAVGRVGVNVAGALGRGLANQQGIVGNLTTGFLSLLSPLNLLQGILNEIIGYVSELATMNMQIRAMQFSMNGVAGASTDALTAFNLIDNAIQSTGQSSLTIRKELIEFSKMGLHLSTKDLYNIEKQNKELLKLRTVITSNQRLSTLTGMNGQKTAQTFREWTRNLHASSNLMSSISRSIRDAAKISGLFGDELEQAVDAAGQFLRKMSQVGVLTAKAARDIIRLTALSKKYGIEQEMAPLMEAITIPFGFDFADEQTQNALVAMSGGDSELFTKIRLGLVGQEEFGQLADNIPKLIQRFTGRTMEELNQLKFVDPEEFNRIVGKLRLQGFDYGTLIKQQKAFQDASMTYEERLQKLDEEINKQKNAGAGKSQKRIDQLELEKSTLKFSESLTSLSSLQEKLEAGLKPADLDFAGAANEITSNLTEFGDKINTQLKDSGGFKIEDALKVQFENMGVTLDGKGPMEKIQEMLRSGDQTQIDNARAIIEEVQGVAELKLKEEADPLLKAQNLLRSALEQLAAKFSPTLTKAIENVANWLATNGKLLEKQLNDWIDYLTSKINEIFSKENLEKIGNYIEQFKNYIASWIPYLPTLEQALWALVAALAINTVSSFMSIISSATSLISIFASGLSGITSAVTSVVSFIGASGVAGTLLGSLGLLTAAFGFASGAALLFTKLIGEENTKYIQDNVTGHASDEAKKEFNKGGLSSAKAVAVESTDLIVNGVTQVVDYATFGLLPKFGEWLYSTPERSVGGPTFGDYKFPNMNDVNSALFRLHENEYILNPDQADVFSNIVKSISNKSKNSPNDLFNPVNLGAFDYKSATDANDIAINSNFMSGLLSQISPITTSDKFNLESMADMMSQMSPVTAMSKFFGTDNIEDTIARENVEATTVAKESSIPMMNAMYDYFVNIQYKILQSMDKHMEKIEQSLTYTSNKVSQPSNSNYVNSSLNRPIQSSIINSEWIPGSSEIGAEYNPVTMVE